MNIVLFGPPGAGKGTQSALLVDRLKMVQISTGDLFRDNIKKGTKLGLEAKGFMDKGLLVPDNVTVGMVKNILVDLDKKSFVLDGFPRNTRQAEALDSMLEEMHLKIEKAVFIDVPRNELLSRLTGRRTCKKCGSIYHVVSKKPKVTDVCDACGSTLEQRDDDKEEVIDKRLETYAVNTLPLKEFYLNQKKCETVIGVGDTEEIYSSIEKLFRTKR
jgi:adenylate kinase